MTPLDAQRLRHIQVYCEEIMETMTRYGASFDAFQGDMDYQKSIAFSILQIGELSSGLSPEFRSDTAEQMPWNAMKGMRNLVAHNYGNMDRRTLWDTANKDIPALKEFCDRHLEQVRNSRIELKNENR